MKIRENIANGVTLLNLVCGAGAIFMIISGNILMACYLVFAGGAMDFADGFVARFLKADSELGKQLDSLADMVTFGVVPAFLVAFLIDTSMVYRSETINWMSVLPSVLIVACSAVRLARFNLLPPGRTFFMGLPTPANAFFIAALTITYLHHLEGLCVDHLDHSSIVLLDLDTVAFQGMAVVLSLLMVSPLPMLSLKIKSLAWSDNKVLYIFLIISVILVGVFQFAGVSLSIIFYILISIINAIYNKLSSHEI